MTRPRIERLPQHTYHETGGWDERRRHADGLSFWRDCMLHRADGYAVERGERREVWLYGIHIPAPDMPPSVTLEFTGMTKSGYLNWVDEHGLVRAQAHVNPRGALETRWYDGDGNPEAHWIGGYHVRVDYSHTEEKHDPEIRYFFQPSPEDRRVLHRIAGPAIEYPEKPRFSRWYEHAARVDGPYELLARATMHQAEQVRKLQQLRLEDDQQEFEYAAPAITEAEASRLRLTVVHQPDTELALDIAIFYTEPYIEALRLIDPDIPDPGIELMEPGADGFDMSAFEDLPDDD
ncbi:hypothetical protein ACFVAJ_17935 [Agromyces sp. NPDC057679]|uniref:hypothetical protein n=1 Tax=Agromyces sp. NPDC057679 TaxID=3346207 RepID=UPI00366B4896